jgi:RimJ/RimL family protein N-acetyltransferase
MELESNRLKMQEVTWDDLENIHNLHSLPEIDEYNTTGIPKDMEETKDIIRLMIEAQSVTERKSYSWKIVKKDSGEFLGMTGMTLSADRFKLGEIYYDLLPSQWGQGYATEIAKMLIKTGFDDFQLHKVGVGVATENIRSIRVLEKTGMIREGLRRKILPIRGKWKDNYHYAIVEDDTRNY